MTPRIRRSLFAAGFLGAFAPLSAADSLKMTITGDAQEKTQLETLSPSPDLPDPSKLPFSRDGGAAAANGELDPMPVEKAAILQASSRLIPPLLSSIPSSPYVVHALPEEPKKKRRAKTDNAPEPDNFEFNVVDDLGAVVSRQTGQGLPQLPFGWDGTDATGFILDPNRTYFPFIVLKSSDTELKSVPGQAVRFIAFVRQDGADAVVSFGTRVYVRDQAHFSPEASVYLEDLARRLSTLPTSDDERNPLWKVMIWEPAPESFVGRERRNLWKAELERRLARALPDNRFELLPTDGEPVVRVVLRNAEAPSTDRALVRQAKGSSQVMEAGPGVVNVKETPEAVIVELRHDRLFRVGSAYLRDETLPRVVEALGKVRTLAEQDRAKKSSLTGKAKEKFEPRKIVVRSYTERARDDKQQQREEDPKLAAARSKVLFMLFAREALLPE